MRSEMILQAGYVYPMRQANLSDDLLAMLHRIHERLAATGESERGAAKRGGSPGSTIRTSARANSPRRASTPFGVSPPSLTPAWNGSRSERRAKAVRRRPPFTRQVCLPIQRSCPAGEGADAGHPRGRLLPACCGPAGGASHGGGRAGYRDTPMQTW